MVVLEKKLSFLHLYSSCLTPLCALSEQKGLRVVVNRAYPRVARELLGSVFLGGEDDTAVHGEGDSHPTSFISLLVQTRSTS